MKNVGRILKMKPKKYITFGSSTIITILMIILNFQSNITLFQYKLSGTASFIRLSGTTTMHDWKAEVEEINGFLNAEINNYQIKKFTALEIEVTTESIKTGKNKMDANMYEALISKTFPKISFKLEDHAIDNSSITITGDLTVAGVTKSITTKIDSEVIMNKIKLSGSFKVKMTDYNIQPPELFFGSVKTGDTVTLNFHLVFNQDTT